MPLPGLKAAILSYLNALHSDQLVKATSEIGDALPVFTGWILAINEAGDNFLADLQDFTPSRQFHSAQREKAARVTELSRAACLRQNWGSEVELHAELQDARVARRGHLVIQRGDEVGGSAANGVGVVESVEGLEAQLTTETLVELDVLEEREVGAPEAGATDGAGTLRGFGSLGRGWRSKGARIEPATEGIWSAGVGVANLIRAAT